MNCEPPAQGDGVTPTTNWRTEVLDPATLTDADLRAELRHDLYVYDHAQHPLSREAMAYRIDRLVTELDLRSHELPRNSGEDAAVHGPTSLREKPETNRPA